MSGFIKELKQKYGREFLHIEEVAEELAVGVEDIKLACKEKQVKTRKIGTKTQITLEQVERLFEEEVNENNIQKDVDHLRGSTVTCQQAIDDEKIILVECDVDMAKGCVTKVKGSNGVDRWMIQIDLGRAPDGKRIRKSKSFKSEEEARQALEVEVGTHRQVEEYVDGVRFKDKIIDSKTPLSTYCEYYLSLCSAKPATVAGYFDVARQLCGKTDKIGLGEIGVGDLNRDTITRFFNEFRARVAQPTINKAFCFLKMVLKDAKEKAFILVNPMETMKKPKTTKQGETGKALYKAFKDEELKSVMEACKAHNKCIYTVAKVLQHTGLRPGELRALEWCDIHFEEAVIHVRQAATQEREGMTLKSRGTLKSVIGSTKTPYSVRKIPVGREVLELLEDWQRHVRSSKEYSKASTCSFVFPSTRGGMFGKSGIGVKFRKAMQEAGLHGRGYELYSFRHTFCTNLIKQGVDIPTVQRLMGDNTTDVILKVYTSVEQRDLVLATDKLRELFKEQRL